MPVAYNELFEIVGSKIFDDIFNYTDITLRNNIRLTPMNNRKPIRGMLYNNVITVMMPDTTHQWYLFMCNNVPISNLFANASVWLDMEDILNRFHVNADFITSDDRLLPKRMVFAHVDRAGNTIIAIERKMFDRISSEHEVFLVINIDTDAIGDRTVVSSIPIEHENINAVIAQSIAYPADRCIGFKDGFAYRSNEFVSGDIDTASYYELYHDENIQFTFSVDLDHRKTYMSSDEELYKDIIIIPAEFTEDRVITYDTISLIVMDRSGRGIYLPFLAEQSVSQLTHTCFSVSSYLIDAAFDKLGVTTGELYVIVSNFSKNNVLVNNGALTEKLYELSDVAIMDLLTGEADQPVAYWAADAMEKRAYAQYLIDYAPNEYSYDGLSKQIECLGLFEFTKTICKHNGEIKNLGSAIESVNITVPAFWRNTIVYPIIYLDGVRIQPNRYSVNRHGMTLTLTFGVPFPVDFTYSTLQYSLMRESEDDVQSIIVSDDNRAVTLPKTDNFTIYRLTNSGARGIGIGTFDGYEILPLTDTVWFNVTESDDASFIIFKDHALDYKFVFFPDMITTRNYHPNLSISDGRNLYFIPYGNDTNSIEIPILNLGAYDVYLNGRFMVLGIDYALAEITNDDETLHGGSMIVIQNLKFLKDTGTNVIEIIKTGYVTITEDVGYVVDNTIPINPNNEAWEPGISRLFINGKLVPWSRITKDNNKYIIDERFSSNGYVYRFSNELSRDFYEAYRQHFPIDYLPGRADICTYLLGDYQFTPNVPVIIDYGNMIFSSYLNEIINRIKDALITVSYINDDTDIVNQLRDYEYLKKFDVIFNESDRVNTSFIDIYPGYLATIPIDNRNHYLYIRRLVKILLGSDTITNHMVVYTGE